MKNDRQDPYWKGDIEEKMVLKKKSIIVLNIFFILLLFLMHWYTILSIVWTIIGSKHGLANYNLFVFNWNSRASLLDFSPIVMLVMIIINIVLYMKEKS